MGQIWLILLGLVITLTGVIFIYDARPITTHFFSFGDQNEASIRAKNDWIYNYSNRWINSVF